MRGIENHSIQAERESLDEKLGIFVLEEQAWIDCRELQLEMRREAVPPMRKIVSMLFSSFFVSKGGAVDEAYWKASPINGMLPSEAIVITSDDSTRFPSVMLL